MEGTSFSLYCICSVLHLHCWPLALHWHLALHCIALALGPFEGLLGTFVGPLGGLVGPLGGLSGSFGGLSGSPGGLSGRKFFLFGPRGVQSELPARLADGELLQR